MRNIKVAGCGYAKASLCVSNEDLSHIVDTNDEWITTRTGISTRYVSESENTSDLACRAALKAIEDANIDKTQIDAIIVATMTSDHITPSTACLVQSKLGLNEQAIMAFDVNAACSGFLYALQIGASLLAQYKCVLVIGAETLSKIIDWQDRNTCVLFGDGAGAMLLTQEANTKEMYFYANSKGDETGILQANGMMMNPPLKNGNHEYGYLQMDGKEVFRFAVKAMEEAILEVVEASGHTMDEIDLVIPHQANLRIINHVARRMKMSEDKFFVNVNEFGNTSAASVAIAFAQAKEKGYLKSGMKVVLVGFGAGFTYAANYMEL